MGTDCWIDDEGEVEPLFARPSPCQVDAFCYDSSALSTFSSLFASSSQVLAFSLWQDRQMLTTLYFFPHSLGRPSTYGRTIQSSLLDMYRIFHVVYIIHAVLIDVHLFIGKDLESTASRSRPFSQIPSNHWGFSTCRCVSMKTVDDGPIWHRILSIASVIITAFDEISNRSLVENDWAV